MSRFCNAATDRVTFGTVAWPTTGTFAFWIYPTWAQTDGVDRFLIDATTASNFFRFEHESGNNLNCGWNVGATDSRINVSSGGYTLTQNAWNLLVLTWDPAVPESRLYLNDTLIGSPRANLTTFDTSGLTRNIGNIDAGQGNVNTAARFAEVALWNRVITATERGNLNALRRAIDCAPSGLVDYLPLSPVTADSPEPNLAGGTVGTVSGTTALTGANHPAMVLSFVSLTAADALAVSDTRRQLV